MPRKPRIIRPGRPHHVTQRGNRRQPVFFGENDYRFYRQVLAEQCQLAAVHVWAYCLMPNHIHLLLVPETESGLTEAVSETHRRYATFVNRRQGWTGHLWQDRFASEPISEGSALFTVVRYIECNPVEAGLCAKPDDWLWSSARVHVDGTNDPLLNDTELRTMIPDWKAFLAGT